MQLLSYLEASGPMQHQVPRRNEYIEEDISLLKSAIEDLALENRNLRQVVQELQNTVSASSEHCMLEIASVKSSVVGVFDKIDRIETGTIVIYTNDKLYTKSYSNTTLIIIIDLKTISAFKHCTLVLLQTVNE